MELEQEKKPIHPWRWRALAVWITIFSGLIIWLFYINQQSRVDSCKQTYEGIRKVFRPFFIPESEQTPKQRADQRRFNHVVNQLKRQCSEQVKVTP